MEIFLIYILLYYIYTDEATFMYYHNQITK
jgi:hypothetical protein